MVISFDLDDTLIPGTRSFKTEDRNLFQRFAGIEEIRKGTIGLFKDLRSRGHSVYIYTTSFRSSFKLQLTFYSYGIPVDKVINQQLHDLILRENKNRSSKYPPAFGIDLHIDDSPGLQIEGHRYNFRTIIMGENDPGWTITILRDL